ncbi:hypothetical protein EEL30_21810 [Brevibacillus laterosporus]|uniref:Uncharacterized protein n=1 Tax=Brevibacillus laterosporus TaxID=1465 RepID=A0A518VCF7_BRELA|nr:hypothetical protein EEL30_21810 [Brevibacillus laterosporus]
MFARVSFDSDNRIKIQEKEELELFIGDVVDCKPLVLENGELKEFYSWSHTYKEEEAALSEGKMKFVTTSDYVELKPSKEYLIEVESFIQKFPTIIIKIRGTVQASNSAVANMLKQMQEVQDKFQKALQSFDKKIEFNQKCDVHIGNLGLLNINQMGYAVDKCTEELQVILNQGWRILAVCPQSNQRRPDYVLGRFNGEDDAEVICINF